jgi:hypothetical protein
MWKKSNGEIGKPDEIDWKQTPEPTSGAESLASPDVYANTQPEKEKGTLGPQRVPSQAQYQPSMPASISAYPANMAAYAEAVDEFRKNATAFIEHIPLLAKAQSSYDKAMRASAEMREVLDSVDNNLRALMNQMAEAVSRTGPDKKKPEIAKLEKPSDTKNKDSSAAV